MSRMKQWLDFWEKCKGKKGSPVLIGLLVGLLLLVITWPDNSSKKQNTQTKTLWKFENCPNLRQGKV